mmetsp:Transcript_109263/g.308240  ORF Transcript_109263/g.308240 Transcript_109263/m.308240 type:complete len:213 (-) Transcript_109263:2529-3167(-)
MPSSGDLAMYCRTSCGFCLWNIWKRRITACQYVHQASRASIMPGVMLSLGVPLHSAKTTSKAKTPMLKWSMRDTYWRWKPRFGCLSTYPKPKAKAIHAAGAQYRGSPAKFDEDHSRCHEPERTAKPKSMSAKLARVGPFSPSSMSTRTLCEEMSRWKAIDWSTPSTPTSCVTTVAATAQAAAMLKLRWRLPCRPPSTSNAASTCLCSSSEIP